MTDITLHEEDRITLFKLVLVLLAIDEGVLLLCIKFKLNHYIAEWQSIVMHHNL